MNVLPQGKTVTEGGYLVMNVGYLSVISSLLQRTRTSSTTSFSEEKENKMNSAIFVLNLKLYNSIETMLKHRLIPKVVGNPRKRWENPEVMGGGGE